MRVEESGGPWNESRDQPSPGPWGAFSPWPEAAVPRVLFAGRQLRWRNVRSHFLQRRNEDMRRARVVSRFRCFLFFFPWTLPLFPSFLQSFVWRQERKEKPCGDKKEKKKPCAPLSLIQCALFGPAIKFFGSRHLIEFFLFYPSNPSPHQSIGKNLPCSLTLFLLYPPPSYPLRTP